jgi:hypothetical protein
MLERLLETQRLSGMQLILKREIALINKMWLDDASSDKYFEDEPGLGWLI